MTMKKCPVCGEKYSETYRNCPFCEEEEALQKGRAIRRAAQRGRRVAKRRQFSLITPTLIVLIIIMSALLIYLLRDDAPDDSQTTVDPPTTEHISPVEPNSGEEPPESGTMPEDPGTTDTPEPEDTTSYEKALALPDGLTLSTTDFSLRELGETHTIRASGGAGGYTWISEDEGVASVDSNGKVIAVSGGTVNVIATDGSKKGVCIVRVTATGSLPGTPVSGNSGSSVTYRLSNEDFTRSISEGAYQLTVSGAATGITWKSSNPSVATVSDKGLVTPVGRGTATITASLGGQTLSCIVRVPG